MSKRNSILILVVVITTVLLLSLQPLSAEDNDYSTVLTALKTDEKITIDGIESEDSWSKAKTLLVTVQSGSIGKIDVTLKALYDSEYLYIYTRWPDPTESVDKKLWNYNGSTWTRSGDEDRLSIVWNIADSVRGFNIGGCAMLCHGDRMHTNAPEEKADEWHWKAARTNPAGYSDDKFINSTVVGYGEDDFGVPTEWTGRHSDTKISGGYKENINHDETGPRYYEPNPVDVEDARFLFKVEIDNGEAIQITPETVFEKSKTVPGYVLEKPVGSRGDIETKGVWKEGVWSLELKRKFNTSRDDDVQFDITKTYRFGVAVMDDTGGFEGFGKGHSFTLGASTIEFGGFGSETASQLALIRDYLLTAHIYLEKDNPGLAISTITEARGLYIDVRNVIAEADPALHIKIINKFETARRNPTVEGVRGLMDDIDAAILTIQGKRAPASPSLGLRILAVWGEIQLYTFIILSIAVLYPLYRTAQTARKPELRRLGIFMFIFISPVFFEGLGRLGILLQIPLLQIFSFTTNEYATLLWTLGMSIALIMARFGFNDVDSTIKSLKHYSEELKKSEIKYRNLFDSTIDGIYKTNKDNTFSMMNQAGAEIFGHKSPEEIIGGPINDYWANPEDREKFLQKLKRKKSVQNYLLKAKKIDGKEIHLETSSRILEDSKGNYLGIEGVVRDVTERRQSEMMQKEMSAALKNMAEELSQSNRLKDIFTDIMRHDLLNPIGLIQSYVELLEDETLTPEVKELIDIISNNADRAIEMIRSASQLAKLEKDDELEMSSGDLGAVLNGAIKDMKLRADQKKMTLEITLDGEYSARFNPSIYEVFTNLTTNAIKYSPEDTKITAGITDSGKYWKVWIMDQGEGIPDEYKEDIFDRFSRIHKGAVEGTGLGLTIVKKIVAMHKGRVWVEDNPEGGSIFNVTVPKDLEKESS